MSIIGNAVKISIQKVEEWYMHLGIEWKNIKPKYYIKSFWSKFLNVDKNWKYFLAASDSQSWWT